MDASDRRNRVAEEAAEWWVLLQGDVSRANREHYVDWLRESSVHVAEMLRVAQVHGALEQFQRWSAIPIDGSREEDDNVVRLPTSEPRAELRKDTPRRGPRRRAMAWSMAAMLIVMTGLAAVLMQSRGGTIQTDRGERREVALADGSVIQVDPETRLRVQYEEHARRVFLERGRALFHVAKNTERPFLVEANNTTVRAVGTAFAVERQHESIVITVAEGKVAVFPAHSLATPPTVTSSPSGSADIHGKVAQGAFVSSTPSVSSSYERTQHGLLQSEPPPPPTGSAPEIYLTANQQVTVSESGSAEAVLVVNSSRALSWADGRLVLENRTVADAVREFNRYNRIQIIVNDTELARRPISGVFNAADPESFIAFLSSVARVHITRGNGTDITVDAAK